MAIFVSRSTRTTRQFSNYVGGPRFFLKIKNNLDERRKCLFSKTWLVFGNSFRDSHRRDRSGTSGFSTSSTYDKDKPCKPKSSSAIGNVCGSTSKLKNSPENATTLTDERCATPSDISRRDTCCSDSRKSATSSTTSRPSLDEPCPRECKLSATIQCPDSTKRKSHPEQSPSICPSSEEIARKMRFWRMIALLGALPVILMTSLVTRMREKEEATKPRPKYVPWDHMYRMSKPFPWGDGKHTLFHNPIKNPIPPDGYEVDDPNEIKENN